ncbi:hypothetical protein SUVZ_05G2020 [Saccharomyces uvarum]|uniref:Uncharacterized protein n=1 Tax=Saccharomyces uvarum TaxID=230603 RepID=A0ABN8WW54_SACUV|nr:hypothetical protein SUVZ_05G2020 [Saccharomyces uvarum]
MNPLHWILTTPEPEEAQGQETLQNVDHSPFAVNDGFNPSTPNEC